MNNNIIEIARKIQEAGGNLYLVGGAIRDKIMGKECHDEDFCVTGLTKIEFLQLFPEAKEQGNAFQVFCMENCEFALARMERKNGRGHKEFEIETNKDITIEQDLARRDITINAIAEEVLTGNIIDPFQGSKDIKNKIIRATTTAFIEDPLRVYRVARFATQLEFNVDEGTLRLMEQLKLELMELSKERVFTELKKALEAKKPSIFFQILRKANVLDVHFKEISDLIGALQPVEYHPEGDAYNHTMIVLDKMAELTEDVVFRFCALVHDIGKGATPKNMYPHHYGHDVNGVELVSKLGRRLLIPNTWIKCGKTAAKEHMKGGIFYRMTVPKKVSFIERVSKSLLGLHGLQLVVIADKCSTRSCIESEISFERIGQECLNAINGSYIKEKYNIQENKEFANRLHNERCEWLKNYCKNSETII